MIIEIISLILCVTGCVMLFSSLINYKKNNNRPVDGNTNKKFAFLIPARDESRVIENLLISIKNQTVEVNMKDVYVIVESLEDKTVDICKKYNASVILRSTKRQRKGYALDEALKQILIDKKYDAYFIFDADNVLDKNYLQEMITTYNRGYDFACGYRNCKNGNDNVFAACSSLTFSMINTLGNNRKRKYSADIMMSGTGFYIKGNLIEEWNGYPFNSLTEDYELSLYITLNSLTSYYNDQAIFYDEQPIKYKDTVKQRIRWIKGYFTSRKKYIPLIRKKIDINNKNYGSQYSSCIGVKPYILIVIGLAMYLCNMLYCIISNIVDYKVAISGFIIMFILIIIFIYLLLMIITYVMIKKDKLNLSKKMKIKAILYNPLYLATYVPCALKAVLSKNVTWDKMEHKVNNFN